MFGPNVGKRYGFSRFIAQELHQTCTESNGHVVPWTADIAQRAQFYPKSPNIIQIISRCQAYFTVLNYGFLGSLGIC